VIQIDVDGRPAPKGSRIMARTKTGKSYSRPASKYEKPWVEAVKTATQIVMRHAQLAPPYRVELEFRLQKPKPNGRASPWPTGHDLDKLARSTIDGLVQGGALSDDRHVTALTASKRYAEPGEQPGVVARVSENAPIAGVRLSA